jgi:large subunit ribosomal protein L20
MARVKRGVTAGRRHKKVLAKAKGYYNARRKVYRAAKQAVIKAGQSTPPRACTGCPTAAS